MKNVGRGYTMARNFASENTVTLESMWESLKPGLGSSFVELCEEIRREPQL